MSESVNPYQPPEVDIQPPQIGDGDRELVDPPRKVAAGRGASWVSEGWPLFAKGMGTWIGMSLVGALIFFALNLIPLIGLLAGFLTPFLMAGWAIGCERMRTEGEVRFEDLFGGFSEHFAPLAIASLIYFAANMVAMMIAVGVTFVLIGSAFALGAGTGSDALMDSGAAVGALLGALIFLAITLPVIMLIWFAPTLIVLHKVSPVEALKLSFFGCLRNILPFLLFGLVTFAMVIAGALALFIGLLFVMPWIACSNFVAYRDIYVGDPA
ncbi:MAG: BPSS1780 family membrane protein [Pseudomonadota bacterium]